MKVAILCAIAFVVGSIVAGMVGEETIIRDGEISEKPNVSRIW